MNIAFDLRGMLHGKVSGIENYTLHILEHLLSSDSTHNYSLLENSWQTRNKTEIAFVNAQLLQKRIPNKILNALLYGLKRPYFEDFFGPFDCLFMPNINFFSIRPETKLVLTVHDLTPIIAPEFYNFKRRLWHSLVNFRSALKRANRIIAVSEYTKNDIITFLGYDPETIRVIPHGINQHQFNTALSIEKLREVRNIYNLPAEYLLFLNTLEPRKNLLRTLAAFETIETTQHLVIAGKKGWNYESLLQRIAQSPAKNRIHYIGYVDEVHKPAVIKLAYMLLYPSLYEGFGFPALEAQAVGVPVLTSNITAMPETVGESALLIDPYNIADIARGMHNLLNDEKLRQTFIQRGFTHAQNYSWENSAQQVAEVFKELS